MALQLLKAIFTMCNLSTIFNFQEMTHKPPFDFWFLVYDKLQYSEEKKSFASLISGVQSDVYNLLDLYSIWFEAINQKLIYWKNGWEATWTENYFVS